MPDITEFLAPLVCDPDPAAERKPRRGRPPMYGKTMTRTERRHRSGEPQRKKAEQIRCIAILDTETDPFDKDRKVEILPFVAELYSDQFEPIVIWDDDFNSFVEKLYHAILSLPDSYTIYAHNGGKFDYMFLVSKLRGQVMFKGRAIMSAKIGNHELRDSLHILPEKLAAWKKDHFDYSKMRRASRHKFRQEILDYLHSDCVYLFDIVKSFVSEFGLKISIGQAAFGELKKSYKVSHVKPSTDEFLRRYFFGGRVECIQGRGMFDSRNGHDGYKLYDVNSMYPFVMANFSHPIGNEYNWRRGNPDENTVFVDLECINHGAFVSRTENNEFGAAPLYGAGKFFVSVWEFQAAIDCDLIEDVRITGVVDCRERTNFSKFVVPMYDRRQIVKGKLDVLKEAGLLDSRDYEELHKEDLFLKYLLNNAYGKFAQNPRNFKEYYYTDPNEAPPAEWMEFLQGADDDTVHKYSMAIERTDEFAVWAKPSANDRYNNVGTAASITGAARSVLLRAIQQATDPVYCDTDSLICRTLGGISNIDVKRLGAWKLEQQFDRVIIAGKKEYACEVRGIEPCSPRRLKVRCKGADLRVVPVDSRGIETPTPTPDQQLAANIATWRNYERLLDNEILAIVAKVPTISKTGEQHYLTRKIRATAPVQAPRAARGKRHASAI